MRPLTADQRPEQPSSAARLKASNALAGRCTARLSAPVSEKVPVWLGGTYVYSDRPTREKLPTTCSAGIALSRCGGQAGRSVAALRSSKVAGQL